MTWRFWNHWPFAWIVRLFTFTPSAEAAWNVYEPIFWLVTPAEMFCVPKALLTDVVKLEFERDNELPVAPPELLVWLEITPWRFAVVDSASNAAVTVLKAAPD